MNIKSFALRAFLAASLMFAASPDVANAQAAPFNSTSIGTLGGNCKVVGTMPYQIANGVTRCMAVGTNGQVVQLTGGVPTWTNPAAGFTATSISTLGGNCTSGGTIPFQVSSTLTACTLVGTDGKVLGVSGGVPTWQTVSGTGSVTSIGLALPSFLTVTGSPVTTTGTISAALASQTTNTVLAAPNGSTGAPSFRQLVNADISGLGSLAAQNSTAISTTGGTIGGATSVASTVYGSFVSGNGNVLIGQNGSGDIELGLTGRSSAGTPFIDFHSSLNSPDFDVRINSTGGSSGSAGAGTFNILSSLTTTSNDFSVAGVGSIASLTVTGSSNIPTQVRNNNTVNLASTAFVAQNQSFADPRNYGAACNGSNDDTASYNTARSEAATYGRAILIACNLNIASATSLDQNVYVTSNGFFTITGSGSMSVDASRIIASERQKVFVGNTDAITSNATPGRISACWWNACTGASDVSNELRSMTKFGLSNKTVMFPPLVYNLCSAIPAGTGGGQVGYPATNQTSVIIKAANNFNVIATGATFVSCAAIAQNIAVMLDTSTQWTWDGGNFTGSRSGLATTTVNAPFQLMNNQRFTLANTTAYLGYGDAGAFFEGDGNTDFVIENNIGNVGQGIDMAFSLNGVYRNNKFYGLSSTATNIGIKCFSHINDLPMISPTNYISTGVTQSENVQVIGNRCDNYVSGIVLQNGRHFTISDNYLVNMKGDTLTSSPGTGILINYIPTGSFNTTGAPVWNVAMKGNQIDNLGTNLAGCGVSLGGNAIANGDTLNRFIIDGNMFSGSAGSTAICADTNNAAKIANFFVGINEYSNLGALMNANASSLAKPATLPR